MYKYKKSKEIRKQINEQFKKNIKISKYIKAQERNKTNKK